MEEILHHLGCMKPFEETTYQLVQVFFYQQYVIVSTVFLAGMFVGFTNTLPHHSNEACETSDILSVLSVICGVVSWLVSALRYVNSPTGTGNLGTKERAKGAIFPLGWWWRYNTFIVRENSGK